jgi:hypothetical protein
VDQSGPGSGSAVTGCLKNDGTLYAGSRQPLSRFGVGFRDGIEGLVHEVVQATLSPLGRFSISILIHDALPTGPVLAFNQNADIATPLALRDTEPGGLSPDHTVEDQG